MLNTQAGALESRHDKRIDVNQIYPLTCCWKTYKFPATVWVELKAFFTNFGQLKIDNWTLLVDIIRNNKLES